MTPVDQILYAKRDGHYYLRLLGDVRVTFCATLKNYLDSLFQSQDIRSVVVDLREAHSVDSTTLGLLAKLALYVENRENFQPLLVVSDESLITLIESMGLEDIFHLVPSPPDEMSASECAQLKFCKADEQTACAQVIDAHKTLMSLNNKNMSAFSDLVGALERTTSD